MFMEIVNRVLESSTSLSLSELNIDVPTSGYFGHKVNVFLLTYLLMYLFIEQAVTIRRLEREVSLF